MEYFTRKITLQDRLKQHECQLYPLFGSCLELRDDSPKGVYQSSPLDLSINSLATQDKYPSPKGKPPSSGIQRLDLEGQTSAPDNSKSRQSDSPVLQKESLQGTTLSPQSISPPNKTTSQDESRDQPSSSETIASCDKSLSPEKTLSSDTISSSDKTTSCDVISSCDKTPEKTPSPDKSSPKERTSPTDRTCIPERSDVLHVQSTLIGGIGKVITVNEGEKYLPDKCLDSGEQPDSTPNKELIQCDVIEDCNQLFKEILEPRASASSQIKHGERSQKSNPSVDLNVVQFNRATIDSENKRRQLTSEPDRDRQQIASMSSKQDDKLCSSQAVTRQSTRQIKSSIRGFIKRNRRAILRKPKSILGVRNAFMSQGKSQNGIKRCPNVNVTDFTDQCAKIGKKSFRQHNGEYSQPQINLEVSKTRGIGDDKELSPQSQHGNQIPSQGHHSNQTVSPSHYGNQPPGDRVSQSMTQVPPRINQTSSNSQHINKISIQRPYGKETFAQGHQMNQTSHLDHKGQLELSKSGKMLSQTRYRGQMINTTYCMDGFIQGHDDEQMKCYNTQSSPPSSGNIPMSEESLVNTNTSMTQSTPIPLHLTNRAPGHGTRTNSNLDTGSGPLTRPPVSSPCTWYKIPQQEHDFPLRRHQMKESMHPPSDVDQHTMVQPTPLNLSTNKKSMPHDFTSVSEETRIKEISDELRFKLMHQSSSVPHSCSGVCLGHDVSPTKVRRPTRSDPSVRNTKMSQNIDRTSIIIDREVLMNLDYQYLLNIDQEKEQGKSASECSNNGTETERNIPTTQCDDQGITMGNHKGRLTTGQQSSTGTDQQSSMDTDQQRSTATDHDQQMSLVIDQYTLTPTEQQRSTPTNQLILTVTDQQRSSTTFHQRSMTTDQQRSMTTDQQRSTTTDQLRSTTTDQQRSTTTDQQMSTSTFQQRSTATFHQRSMTTDQQMSMTTDQQRSMTTDQQRSTVTYQQRSMTTDQQRLAATDQQRSMAIDQKMIMSTDQQRSTTTDQQRSTTTGQQRSTAVYQQRSTTTGQQWSTVIYQLMPTTTDQQRSTATDQQRSMSTDQQRSTATDQQRSTTIGHQKPTAIYQQRSTINDQQRSTINDQQSSISTDQKRSMSTDHQRSTTTDQQWSTTTVQQRSTATDQQRPMSSDHQRSTASDQQRSTATDQQRSTINDQQWSTTTVQQRSTGTDHQRPMSSDQQRSTASDQQRSTATDQQRSMFIDHQRSPSAEQLGSTANDLRWPSDVNMETLHSTEKSTSSATAQEKSVATDFKNSKSSTDDHEKSAIVQQSLSVNNQNISTNDSDISERRKGMFQSPAADHCEQIMTSVTTHMDGADDSSIGWNLSVSKTIDLHSDCNNCKACRRIFAKLRIPPIVSPDNPPNTRRTDFPCTVFNTRLRHYNK